MRHQQGVLWIPLLVSIAAVLAYAATALIIYRIDRDQPASVACTQEAKLCPDGTYVGRVGPSCDFVACPTVRGNTNVSGAQCGGIAGLACPSGYVCEVDNVNVADAFGACILSTNTNAGANVNQASNTNAVSNTNNEDVAITWKTYTNSTNQYSFRYPTDWTVNPNASNPSTLVVSPPDADERTSIELGPTMTVRIATTVPDAAPSGASSADVAEKYDCTQNRRTLEVNGVDAIQQDESCFSTLVTTYLPYGAEYSVFSWPEVFEDEYPEYEQILSTFQFAE